MGGIHSSTSEFRKLSCSARQIRAGVNQNYQFLRLVIESMPRVFGSIMYIPPVFAIDSGLKPTQSEMEEVFTILREMRREWSAEGKSERDQCFLPLLERAEKLHPKDRGNVRVLVPGQRLGRIVFEFAKKGFRCEGQDNSFLRFACSHFMLNSRIQQNQYTFHPFLHCSKNYLRDDDRTRSVTFPDENLQAVLSESSSCSTFLGDFIASYGTQKGEWHIIATCYFLHTVMDSIECIKVVFDCLIPGGYWLNFGSLMSNTDRNDKTCCLTPSYEDLLYIIRDIGFIILEQESNVNVMYSQNSLSMHNVDYKNVLLVCKKPTEAEAALIKSEPIDVGEMSIKSEPVNYC